MAQRPNAMLHTRRGMSMQCANCPDLAPCPKCPTGQTCQLSIPPSCAQCAKNACVPDPEYRSSHSSASSVGGAVGGVLCAFALAGVLFWLWRKRRQRAKTAVRSARMDAKVRAATAEKFRPGGAREKSLIKNEAKGGDGRTSHNTASSPHLSSHAIDGDEGGDDELDEEDVEWTELREDGLTAYRNRPGEDGLVEQDAAALKRQSVGAATHLSRITEGAEDDDDDELHRHFPSHSNRRQKEPQQPQQQQQSQRNGPRTSTIAEEMDAGAGSDTHHVRGHSSSASIGKEMNRARSRKSGRGSNPFLDVNEVASITSGTNASFDGSEAVCSSALEHSNWSAPTELEAPSRVHRPVGAPLVDLQGKPKSPAYVAASALTRNAGTRSPLSPTSVNQQSAAPSRPSRKPELNLRLADGSEPGKIGDDLRRPGTQSSLAASYDGNAIGLPRHSVVSPTATSSAYGDERRDTIESEGGDYPSELAKSVAYGNHLTPYGDKRNSALTTITTSSAGSMDYAMSAPQIISPMVADGAKRMQLNKGKAHLVRSLSSVRREQEERKALRAARGGTRDSEFLADSQDGGPSNPFSDMHSSRANTGRSVSPANTFGRGNGGDASSDFSVPLSVASKGDPSMMPPFAQRAFGFAPGQTHLDARSRPQSGMSAASLPFVDQRPMRQPTDRSPTDATSRESVFTVGSHNGGTTRNSAMSSMSGGQRGGIARRQSGASIGSLSVFDEIPFHIGGDEGGEGHVEISMPDDAQARIQEAKERISGQTSSSHMVDMTMSPASTSDVGSYGSSVKPTLTLSAPTNPSTSRAASAEDEREQPPFSPFHDSNANVSPLVREEAPSHHSGHSEGRITHRESMPVSMMSMDDGGDDNGDDDNNDDDVAERELDATRTEVQPTEAKTSTNEDFAQLRLRHELDGYPFQMDGAQK